MDLPNYLNDPIQFYIDNDLRIITIPSDGVVLGVVNDKNVNRINFSMPRYYNGFDMSLFSIRVNYVNPAGQASFYDVTDATIINEDDRLVFTWLVDLPATMYVGDTSFVVRLFKVQDEVVAQNYSTTIGVCKVLEGITVDIQISPEDVIDILANVKIAIDDYTNVKKQELDDIIAQAVTYKGAYTGTDLNMFEGPTGIYDVIDTSAVDNVPDAAGMVTVIKTVRGSNTEIIQLYLTQGTGNLWYRRGIKTATSIVWPLGWNKVNKEISDAVTDLNHTWSSSKIAEELADRIAFNGTYLGDSVDDLIEYEGIYEISRNDEGIPVYSAGILWLLPIDNSTTVKHKQLFISNTTGTTYYREYYIDAWTPWKNISDPEGNVEALVNKFRFSEIGSNSISIIDNGLYTVESDSTGYPETKEARLELTGDETWIETIYGFKASILPYLAPTSRTIAYDTHGIDVTVQNSDIYCSAVSKFQTLSEFIDYLKEQKSNNTPVTVYHSTRTAMPIDGAMTVIAVNDSARIQTYTHAQTLYEYKRLISRVSETAEWTATAWERMPTLGEVNRPCRLS